MAFRLRVYLLLLILFAGSSFVFAKKDPVISGIVRDPSGSTVEFATVALHRASDSTVVKTEFSDASGTFHFDHLPAGNYFVSASQVGFEREQTAPFTIASDDKLLAPILLKPSSKTQLKEVTVQARKPLFERETDRIVVNVDGSPLSAGATSLEVLSRSPGVTVDQNDNLALRGKQGVLVLIDGKRVPMTGTELAEMLRGLPANSVDKIELITNPPAKYDAAGSAGIISIKLKKDSRQGTNGSVNASYGYGQYGKLTSGISLNHRHKKVNLFGSFNHNDRNVYTRLTVHRDFYQNSLFAGSSDQDNVGKTRYISDTYRAGLDYTLSKRTLMGVVVNGLVMNAEAHIPNVTQTYDERGALQSSYQSANRRNLSTPNTAVNMNLKHSFDSTGRRELTADADYAHYETHRLQNLATTFSVPVRPATILDGNLNGDLDISSAKVDYVHTLKNKTRLEAGVKMSWVRSDNNVLFTNTSEGKTVIDTGKSNQFRYDENINAAYINVSRTIKKMSIQAGLRGEQTNATGLQLVGNDGFERHYFQLFPSVFIKQTLSKSHDLGLSLSRRIDRPTYNQLNPFRAYIDATTYFSGNPSLYPQSSYNIELTHTFKQKFITSFSYSRTDQPIISVVQPAPEGNRQVVSTFQNLTRSDYYGLTLTIPVQPTSWWTMDNNIVAYYNRFIGDLAGTSLNTGLPAYSINVANILTLGKGWTADLGGFYQSHQLYGFFDIRPQGQLNVGLQKSMWAKKGVLKLNMTDIFYTSPLRATSTYNNYIEQLNQRQDTRVATISFSYRFGSDTVTPSRRRTGGAEDEKRRAGSAS
ncbi:MULTISPECIES: outer membrane beta-barrel protein [unclassified Spirosoma]|uniref:outer membrane beta-barrel protein n=1 Tax=unclassified Spirosoma TaxID=2621999 RepID=UPI00095E9DC4|nr:MULTISPECIES: outer membrane beta-barrel protein [unclassified Spirosoma]MBN8823717.1 outer membrane beta-barrel protein [Spirosoma sp.]OJW76736.1 MAG: TonB-dependent receptor [Spirosoma sp. 48-14]